MIGMAAPEKPPPRNPSKAKISIEARSKRAIDKLEQETGEVVRGGGLRALERARKKKWILRVKAALERFYHEYLAQGWEQPGVITECMEASLEHGKVNKQKYEIALETCLGIGAWRTIMGHILGWERIEKWFETDPWID